MVDVAHSTLGSTDGIHVVQRWTVASATARLALTLAESDIGGIAFQQSDNSFWLLVSMEPTWQRLGGIDVTDVYVSSLTGSDANDGLSPSAPFATLGRAWDLLPDVQTQPFVVHVDGGAHATAETRYEWATPPANTQRGPGGFILIVGDGAGQGTNDGTHNLLTGTVTGASTASQLTVTGGGMTVDAYRDYTVEMTSGTASGQRKHCTGNSATVLDLITTLSNCASFGNTLTPANGDGFRVFAPNVAVDFATDALLSRPGQLVHWVNVAWLDSDYGASYDAFAPRSESSEVLLYGVELRGAGQTTALASNVYAGIGATQATAGYLFEVAQYALDVFPLLLAALGNPVALDSGAWNGWGFAATGATVATVETFMAGTSQGLRLYGYLAGHRLFMQGDCIVNLQGFDLQLVAAYGGAQINLDSIGLDFGTGVSRIGNSGSSPAIVAGSLGRIFVGWTNSCSVNVQCSGPVVSAEGNAFVLVNGPLLGTSLSAGSSLFYVDSGGVVSLYGANVLAGGAGSRWCNVAGGTLLIAGASTLSSALAGLVSGGVLEIPAAGNLAATVSGDGALLCTGGTVIQNGTCTWTGTLAAGGAVVLRGASARYTCQAGAFTAQNNSAGANADSIRVEQGARMSLLSTAAAGSAGASGYGARLSANAALTFDTAPGGSWHGVTNDLLVDATAIAKAALAANTATVGAGASVAVAMT